MATLFNTKISATYEGLIKTIDNVAISATLKEISDGAGNQSGLYINSAGDLKVSAVLEWGSLKDTGTGVVITRFVTSTDGIENFDNNTSLPTSAAVKLYVDTKFASSDTLQEVLAFGNSTSGNDIVVSTGDDITFADSSKALFGSGNELQIFHDGSTSTVYNTADLLTIESNKLRFQGSGGLSYIIAYDNLGVIINYNNAKKFETTNTGVAITGRISGLTDPTLAQDAATKSYVDNIVTIQDLDFTGNSGSGAIDLDSEILSVTGTNGATTTASGNNLNVDTTVLQTGIATNVTNIATNVADIATNSTDIASNLSLINTNITNIATNVTNISSNDTDIATNTSNISSNDADIAGEIVNRTNADTVLQNNIDTNSGDITTLESDVVYKAGTQTISGAKTFSSALTGTSATFGDDVVISGSSKAFKTIDGSYYNRFAQRGDTLDLSANEGAVGAGGDIRFQVGGIGGANQKMIIQRSGNVGIGTDSPDTKLHVSNTTKIDDAFGLLLVENTSTGDTNSGVNVKNHYGTSQFMQWENHGLRIGSRILSNSGVGDVIFTSGSDTERMRITSGGGISFGSTGTAYGTTGQVLTSNGNASPTWVSAAGGVSGSNSVYVTPTGTAAQNGVLLLAGLTSAIAKIGNVTTPGSNIGMQFYQQTGPSSYDAYANNSVSFSPGPQYQATFDGSQVLITVISVGNQGPSTFSVDITDLNGNPIFFPGAPDFPTPSITVLTPSTLIIAPGDYSIASDFILNNLVNVTSLTGQADVNISTSNVKIQSGANNSSHPISVTGLNLTSSLWIESNLSFLTFKNCVAIGSNSFSIQPSGTGSITGVFEDCIGGFRSFGGGVGVTAAGLFTRCKVTSLTTNGGAFGGKGSTSGRFEYCGGATRDSYGGTYIPSSMFGNEGVSCSGYFYYCIGGNQSFASGNTGSTNAEFHYCIGGNQSFAYRNTNNSGKFYNCSSDGNNSFGSNPLNGDLASNANYYNCTGTTIATNAVGIGSKFYNCHATINWSNYSAGNGGLAYNCSFGAFGGQGAVSGTGKYRNCLDSSFTIINQG